MEKNCQVWVTKFAEKQLRKVPKHIVAAFYAWVKAIEIDGIASMRALPGYHDELLKGDRKGQRSSRLGKGYRVIYEETNAGNIVLVAVQEVNKHDY